MWELSLTALEGDFQNLKSMVRHARVTTYINGCYDNFETNKESYQPFPQVHINYDKSLSFQKDYNKESTNRLA